jgi:hypothetical protein
MLSYYLVYDSLDQTLPQNISEYQFDLSDLHPSLRERNLTYSIDNGSNQLYDYSAGDTLTLQLSPGEHTFQFYAGSEYQETELMYLTIEDQHRQLYKINFRRSLGPMHMRKPVMYFYPEETTKISVDVKPQGSFTFTYPNIDTGWNFTCDPNGTLTRGEESYRYLFWESQQSTSTSLIDRKQGTVISGSKTVAYLEEQMTAFGMTSEERADLITYWGPLMQNKTNVYIYLLFNEECDAFASLKISPEPSEIARFYVIWTEVPDNYNLMLESQSIPKMQRDGFTVLEWGGAEVEAESILMNEL